MSTGGFDGLNKEKLLPLKGRQIRLFPDLGCYDGWLIKAEEIMKSDQLKIEVFKGLEKLDKEIGLKEGEDIADLYLNLNFSSRRSSSVTICSTHRRAGASSARLRSAGT